MTPRDRTILAIAAAVVFVADVPASGGWVEWLQASDGGGGMWTDVNVVPADLTGDGVPEFVVGSRSSDEKKTLDLDVVSYTEAGLPQVVAHRSRAAGRRP